LHNPANKNKQTSKQNESISSLAEVIKTIEGLRERTEYVSQPWNWENHS